MECFAFACLIELAAARLFFLTLWGHIYIYNMDCRGLAISTCSNVHKTVSWYCHRAIGAGFCVFARRKTIALGCSVQRSVIILHPYPTYLCLLFLPTCDKIIRFHNQKGCLKFGMMLSHSIAVYGRSAVRALTQVKVLQICPECEPTEKMRCFCLFLLERGISQVRPARLARLTSRTGAVWLRLWAVTKTCPNPILPTPGRDCTDHRDSGNVPRQTR